jgi:hypothetical protein
MTRKIIALLAILLVVTAGLPGVAIAQESTTDKADEKSEEQPDEPTEYELVISDSLRVIDAEWDGNTFVARVEADRSTTITIVDAGRSSDGTFVDLRPQTYDVSRNGVTEIRYTVAEDRAVTLNADGGVWLFADDSGGVEPLPQGDWTAAALIVSSVIAFFLILAFALFIGHIRKNKTETVA